MYTRKQIEEMLEEAPYKIQIKSIEIIRQLLDEREEIKRKIEGMKCDERKTHLFGEWEVETYEEKSLVNAVLSQVLALFKEE